MRFLEFTSIVFSIFSLNCPTQKNSLKKSTETAILFQANFPNNKINERNEFYLAYINPTGTYKLVSKRNIKNGEVYGYSGRIQVKRLSADKIVMTFYVNRGAPSYNSGSFVDTLTYKHNIAVYYAPKDIDPTCTITFRFNKKGVEVVQKSEDFNFGCGFGHSVVANGFFKRISSKVPVLVEPLTSEKLEK